MWAARDTQNYARSYALLANTRDALYVNRYDSDYLNPAALELAHQFARKAVKLDANLPDARAVLGFVLMFKHQDGASMTTIQRALALNPNYVDWRFGYPLVLAGHSSRAIDLLTAYMQLDPFDPPLASFFMGVAQFMLKEYSQALAVLGDFVSPAPALEYGHLWLAVTHVQLGQLEEARAEIAEVLRLNPDRTIAGSIRTLAPFKQAKDDKHFYDARAKQGCPSSSTTL